MPKRKLEELASTSEGTTVSQKQSVVSKNGSEVTTAKAQPTSERKASKPRRQITVHHVPSGNCADSCASESVSCANCETKHKDSEDAKCSNASASLAMDHTYNDSVEKDVNNHNNTTTSSGNVNKSNVDINSVSFVASGCGSENKKVGFTSTEQVSELVNILSSDSDLKSISKVTPQKPKVLKSILKVRTSPFNCQSTSSDHSNSFVKGCATLNTPTSKSCSTITDKTPNTRSTNSQEQISNKTNTSDFRQSSLERDSLESNVESLSDKEIENDSVFESSNETIDASPNDPKPKKSLMPQDVGSSSTTEEATPVKWSCDRKGRRSSVEQNGTHAETPDLEPPRKRKKNVHFEHVKLFYFTRKQGFTCVPSQGGSTLGMSENHIEKEDLTIDQHAKLKRKLHKHILLEQHRQGKIHIPPAKLRQLQQDSQQSEEGGMNSPTSTPGSPASQEGEDLEARFSSEESSESEDDLQVDEYYFLQPIPTRQRRIMLRQSGVKKIDTVEKDLCKDIRTSREVCGCDCKGYCDPATCICSLAGIKCQVDRPSFPCGCTKDCCRNPEGRVEFNPIRVRTHFIHTLMRLENERKMEQRKRAIAVAKRRRHLRFLEESGAAVDVETKSEVFEQETVNNSDDDNEDDDIDVSMFNSNELGSCRDCQTSDVSNFLIRQQQRQQQQLQQQQQQQQHQQELLAANQHQQQSTYNNTSSSDVASNEPPSCMENGGVQQAYMTALDETAQMNIGNGAEVVGNMEADGGQLYVNGEDYIAESTTDMFAFTQEESSYSESSEDCSSVGSNPDAEVVVGGGNGSVVYNNSGLAAVASTGYVQSQQQQLSSSSDMISQQYDPSKAAIGSDMSGNNHSQGRSNDIINHQQQQSILGGVGGNCGIQQQQQVNYIPANNNYHQLQPSTVEVEQKYMEMNGTAAASFKLEPISEILNPIRFPGYPDGSWNGPYGDGGSSGGGMGNMLQGGAQTQESSHSGRVLMNGSGEGSVCTVQQYTTLSDVGVLNAKSFTANTIQQQQSVQDCNDAIYNTQRLQGGDHSVKNHENLSASNVESISMGQSIGTNSYCYPHNNLIYSSNSLVASNVGHLQPQNLVSNCNSKEASSMKLATANPQTANHNTSVSGQLVTSSVKDCAKKRNIKGKQPQLQQPKPRMATRSTAETKSYHELKPSSCHSASEAVYSSNVTLLQPSDTSVNLNLPSNQESHLHAISNSSTSSQSKFASLDANSCIQEPDTTSMVSNNVKCSSSYNVTGSSCIQGLGELVDSVSSAVSSSTLSLVVSSICPQTDTGIKTTNQHKELSSSTSADTTVQSSGGSGVVVVGTDGNQEEAKSDGTATDDSEDSGLGSMTDDQNTTQNFGEIIKKSIVETVSA